MSDSKSSNFVHVVWVALVGAFLLLNAILLFVVLASNIEYVRLPPKQSIEEQIQEEKKATETNPNTNADISNIKAQSGSEKYEEYRKHQQEGSSIIFDIRDAYAQEGMWLAAYALVALTFIQIVIGFITIYLVWSTFKVQKREADQAQHNSILQLRPYLSMGDAEINIKDILVSDSPSIETVVVLTFAFEVENHGQSSAEDLEITMRKTNPAMAGFFEKGNIVNPLFESKLVRNPMYGATLTGMIRNSTKIHFVPPRGKLKVSIDDTFSVSPIGFSYNPSLVVNTIRESIFAIVNEGDIVFRELSGDIRRIQRFQIQSMAEVVEGVVRQVTPHCRIVTDWYEDDPREKEIQ